VDPLRYRVAAQGTAGRRLGMPRIGARGQQRYPQCSGAQDAVRPDPGAPGCTHELVPRSQKPDARRRAPKLERKLTSAWKLPEPVTYQTCPQRRLRGQHAATPGISTNKPRRLHQRRVTYSTAPPEAARTAGVKRRSHAKAGRRGPIAGRIVPQAVPPPNTMNPGSRSRISSHPEAAPGFRAAPLTAGRPVDVRRLEAGAARRHRQNYVGRCVFERPQMPWQEAKSAPVATRPRLFLFHPAAMTTYTPLAPE